VDSAEHNIEMLGGKRCRLRIGSPIRHHVFLNLNYNLLTFIMDVHYKKLDIG